MVEARRELRLDALQANVRELTTMVVEGSLPGLFVVGPGGLGKTHSVLAAFRDAGIEPRTLNSHATARGLYLELYEARDDKVVLMEDLEQLFGSLPALSLLRSVLWGPKSPDGTMRRVATWTTAKSGEDEVPPEFEFKAGIVLTANKFPKGEVFASLETRVPVVRFDVEEADVFAFMRKVTRDGQAVFENRKTVHLSAANCEEVIAHLEIRGATDLRKLHHALTLYARHRESGRWRGLLDTILSSSVSARPKGAALPKRPDEKEIYRQELRVAHEIASRSDLSSSQRVDLWLERSGGRSRATFFRRVREAQEGGRQFR